MNKLSISKLLRTILRYWGYDVLRYDHKCHPVARRYKLLQAHGIDLVFDIGANVGRYGLDLRNNGYKGKIISFEPLETAFDVLSQVSASDSLWIAEKLAIGDRDDKAILNVSLNGASSSILNILPRHITAAPRSEYIARETVTVHKLDSIFHNYTVAGSRCFMKIDTQGYESKVIEGASAILSQILGIQLEVAIMPLYEGETLLSETLDIMEELGFTLMSIEPGLSDPNTGQLLQVDCILYRPNSLLLTKTPL